MVDTIIMMARNLGLEAIAEGGETEQELLYLNRQGCFICQGYYFSKPVEEGPYHRYGNEVYWGFSTLSAVGFCLADQVYWITR